MIWRKKKIALCISIIVVSQLFCDTVDSNTSEEPDSNDQSQYISGKNASTDSYIIFHFESDSIFINNDQGFLSKDPKIVPFYMYLADDVISNSNLRQLRFVMEYVDSTLQGLNLNFAFTYGKIPTVGRYEILQQSDKLSFNLISVCYKSIIENCDYSFGTDFRTLGFKFGTIDIVELTSSHIKARFDIDFISNTGSSEVKTLSGEFLQIF